jgi:hypothetical protein
LRYLRILYEHIMYTIYIYTVYIYIYIYVICNRYSYGRIKRVAIADYIYIHIVHITCGASGSIVVKALCYKPEGRGFDSQ